MLFNELRRLMTWLTQSHAKMVTDKPGLVDESPTALAFDPDPVWHGDHWQNLLSSPMDARRYVMEDWSISVTPEWTAADLAAHAH